MAAPIRVLIVEDSVTQREILRRLLAADPDFTLVAEARNGREAVEKVQEHLPDVVLMDIHMPDMDGIAATREIMRRCPVPIVVASATLKKRDVDLAMQAYEAGAVAVIEKPGGAALLHLHKMGPELRGELIAASKAKLPRWPQVGRGATAGAAPAPRDSHSAPVEVIGICASTGGPPVLQEIFSLLPKPFPVPILLVQHISHGFEEGFVHWLSSSTGQPARLAADGQSLSPGIWAAPGGKHLTLGRFGRLELRPGKATEIHCPSGNPLFESLGRNRGERAAGVVLTGMGDDGAQGLLALRQAGGVTIIQDESSCLIWGMPRAAQERGAATLELNPALIAGTLAQLAKGGKI
jgi:two-component system chemotaxis response regulator CheB